MSRRPKSGSAASCLHRSVEAEALLSFTGLSDLLAPVFEEVAPSLAELRRRALEVALLLAEPGKVAPDPRAIGLALLDVLQMLAERQPVVLALDDLQWLDPSSAGVLQIALRRLRDERVGLLATVRTAPDTAVPVELDRAFTADRLARLPIGPLSLGALHHLLRERVGLDLTRPELVRVQEASAGNPFFALELGRELVRTGSRPTAGKALPVPESLYELLGGRLARLPTDTGDVVLFAAALARPTVELVVKAHGHRETVVEALDTAAREGVVELDDSRLRFAHPLLASICYEQAPIWKRRAIHGALARAVADVEERARHMALSVDGPDAVAASYLDAAAEQAAARGATSGGSRALRARSRPDAGRPRRCREHGACGRRGSIGSRATSAGRGVARAAPARRSVRRRAVRRPLRAGADTQADLPRLIELCDEALAEAGGRRRALREDPRLPERDCACTRRTSAGAWSTRRAALERAERVGDPTLLATGNRTRGARGGVGCRGHPGLARAGARRSSSVWASRSSTSTARVSRSAAPSGRLGRSSRLRAILEELGKKAAERGDEATRIQSSGALSLTRLVRGPLAAALDNRRGVEVTEQTPGSGISARSSDGSRPSIETDLGHVEDARARSRGGSAGLGGAVGRGQRVPVPAACWAGSSWRSATSRRPGDHLRDFPGRALALGYNDPTAPFWADAIETLVALGELEQARAYLEPYEAPCGDVLGEPVGDRRRGALPRPPRRRRGRPAGRVRGLRHGSRRAGRPAVPARARPHPALPRHGAQAGAAEEGRPRGAGAGARDLRGARRPPLGGEGPRGAQADQRSADVVGRADRDRAAGRRARRRRAAPTRRSPPSSSWE